MAIPDYQTTMLPLLRELADGRERTVRELTDVLAETMGLSAEERERMMPGRQQLVFHSRVSWAKTYLKAAGLVKNPVRGRVCITDEGQRIAASDLPAVDTKFLQKYASFQEFLDRSKKKSSSDDAEAVDDDLQTDDETPLEQLTEAFQAIQEATIEELLTRLKNCSPRFFERAVIKLLLAMGYGGVEGSGHHTGQSGDGGIDGWIQQDKLGLDIVGIQAKRWEGTVGRAVVQQFVGSMDFIRAKKGVILTTSQYSREATTFVDRIEAKKVVLIDGAQLAELMISYDVGVTTTETYELKEVSNDFFDEDDG